MNIGHKVCPVRTDINNYIIAINDLLHLQLFEMTQIPIMRTAVQIHRHDIV